MKSLWPRRRFVALQRWIGDHQHSPVDKHVVPPTCVICKKQIRLGYTNNHFVWFERVPPVPIDKESK
jgi:hypothetical protein